MANPNNDNNSSKSGHPVEHALTNRRVTEGLFLVIANCARCKVDGDSSSEQSHFGYPNYSGYIKILSAFATNEVKGRDSLRKFSVENRFKF